MKAAGLTWLAILAATASVAALGAETATAGASPSADPASAENQTSLKPLWEFGLGPGVLVLNDYRGAATSHAYPLPVPYFVYRGKFLQADRDGLKGKIFDQKFMELHISASATPPVSSAAARSGMPDLRPTVEVGPALDTRLYRSEGERIKVDLLLSVRGAATIEHSPRFIGWIYDPHFTVDIADPFGQDGNRAGWKMGVVLGPLFADRRYHDYFYSVAPPFATTQRPAYQAAGGYAGTESILSLSRRFPHFWTGAYVRYDTLSGAAFEGSPLVKRNRYWSAGWGAAWILKQSPTLVEAED